MVDILLRDSLRRNVEAATGGVNTVLYDSQGNPSFMVVIPRMTIGEVFDEDAIRTETGVFNVSNYLEETHPAFKIQTTEDGDYYETPEIFISQYHNTIIDGLPYSIPGVLPSFCQYGDIGDGSGTSIQESVAKKGDNWHVMNIWEYSLLQMWCYKNDIELRGSEDQGYMDRDGNAAEVNVITMSWAIGDDPDLVIGEKVGDGAGNYFTIEKYTIIDGIKTYYIMYHSYKDISDYSTIQSLGPPYDDIVDIFIRYIEGDGSVKWRHNEKFTGVYGLISHGEFIDGIRIDRPSGTVGDYIQRVYYGTNYNYRGYDDNYLKSLNCKVGVNPENGNCSIVNIEDSPGINDYQLLSEETAWLFHGTGYKEDGHWPAITAYFGDDPTDYTYESELTMANHSTNKFLTLTGLDPVNFPGSSYTVTDKAANLFVHPYSTTDTEYILIKGHPLNVLNQIKTYGSPGSFTNTITATDRNITNNMWFNTFVDKFSNRTMLFRSCYII